MFYHRTHAQSVDAPSTVWGDLHIKGCWLLLAWPYEVLPSCSYPPFLLLTCMAHRLSNRDHRTFLAHDGRAPCRATSLVVLGPVLGLSGRFLSAASTPLTLPSTAKRCFTKCYPGSRPTPLHSQQPFLTTTTGAKRTNSRATLSNALGCPSISILNSLKQKDCWHPSTKIQAAHKSQLRGNHSLSAYIMLKGLN